MVHLTGLGDIARDCHHTFSEHFNHISSAVLIIYSVAKELLLITIPKHFEKILLPKNDSDSITLQDIHIIE